ncbi:MAG: ChrR family anti-sigma-E factor [Roseivivax sp.]|nr:ChrR family anti-sigma-E factor [Roseivivax sp.]
MSSITHHVPDAMLAAYAAGALPQAFSTVVATHVSLCPECRAGMEAHHGAGGALLEDTPEATVTQGTRDAVLALLDMPFVPEPVYERRGIYPGPVAELLKGQPPQWKTLGMGVRQSILSETRDGSVRLLSIPPGQAVPDHGHNGIEMTLVLQGSFTDETGRFAAGDLEVADETLEHTPVADAGETCICLAATDAPLRFRALVPRLLQPIFRI